MVICVSKNELDILNLCDDIEKYRGRFEKPPPSEQIKKWIGELENRIYFLAERVIQETHPLDQASLSFLVEYTSLTLPQHNILRNERLSKLLLHHYRSLKEEGAERVMSLYPSGPKILGELLSGYYKQGEEIIPPAVRAGIARPERSLDGADSRKRKWGILCKNSVMKEALLNMQAIELHIEKIAAYFEIALYESKEFYLGGYSINFDPTKGPFLERNKISVRYGDYEKERFYSLFCERIEVQVGSVEEEQRGEWVLQIESILKQFALENEMGGATSLDSDSWKFLIQEGSLSKEQVNMVRQGTLAMRLFKLYKVLRGVEPSIFSFFPDVHVLNRLFDVYYKAREEILDDFLKEAVLNSTTSVNFTISNDRIFELFETREVSLYEIVDGDKNMTIPCYFWPEDRILHVADALDLGKFDYAYTIMESRILITVTFSIERETHVIRKVPIGEYEVPLGGKKPRSFIHYEIEELTREFQEDMRCKVTLELAKIRSFAAEKLKQNPTFLERESYLKKMGLWIENIADAYGFEVGMRSYLKTPFKFGKNVFISHWNRDSVLFREKRDCGK